MRISLERALLGDAGDVVGARQRHPRHRRGLDRERREVLGLEVVDAGLAAGPGEHLHLERQRVQEVEHPLGGLVDVQPLAQLGVLGSDPNRAAARVAVVALAGGHADRALVVGDARDLLVAVERHQRRVADRDRVGAERQALGDVAAVADPARDHEVDLVGEADVLERPARLGDRRQQRDPGLLSRDVRTGAGAALGPVQIDDVRAALGGHADVVVDACGAELELDRDLVVGRLARLLHLQREVVGAEPVRVARRRPLVDPGGQERISATCSVTF